MSEEEILSKKALITIGIISVLVMVIGMILLGLGYNEAFYLNYTLIQTIFKAITYLGEAIVLILIIAIFFFAYDKRFAKNLAFSLLFSAYINEFVKDIFQDPRPSTNADPEAEYGLVETSYGFPSGHTQTALAVWGYLGYEFKNKPKPFVTPILVSLLIFLIAISRIIIGVHDLQDIIGGYAIGICLLVAFIYLEPIIAPKINKLNLIIKILLAVAISISLFAIGTLLFPTAGLGLVENPPLYPDEGSFAQVGGAMLGLSVGYLLENEYVKYNPSELNKKQKIINLIIGVIILLVVYLGLDLIISGNVFLRFVRYALISLILIFLVPIIFKKINRT
ncbi:MAG: phosphatase PAP2 family protein [Candidatus Hodarchaeota archaeon]